MAISRNGNTSEEVALAVMQTEVLESQRDMIDGWEMDQALRIYSGRDEDDEEDEEEDGEDADEDEDEDDSDEDDEEEDED